MTTLLVSDEKMMRQSKCDTRFPLAKNNRSKFTFQPLNFALVALALGVGGVGKAFGNIWLHWRCGFCGT